MKSKMEAYASCRFTDTWSGTASYGIETESRSTAHTLNIGVSKTF